MASPPDDVHSEQSVMRIHVTGNAGAGKTTLAKRLATDLGLPLFHLDAFVWLPGWKNPFPSVRKQRELELASRDRWLIEGVSDIVREQADLTLYLDVPRHVCLARCVRRNIPYLFASRPELPPNCPEALIFPRLLSIIWNFPRKAGARISAQAQLDPRIIRIADSAEAANVVRTRIPAALPNRLLRVTP